MVIDPLRHSVLDQEPGIDGELFLRGSGFDP